MDEREARQVILEATASARRLQEELHRLQTELRDVTMRRIAACDALRRQAPWALQELEQQLATSVARTDQAAA